MLPKALQIKSDNQTAYQEHIPIWGVVLCNEPFSVAAREKHYDFICHTQLVPLALEAAEFTNRTTYHWSLAILSGGWRMVLLQWVSAWLLPGRHWLCHVWFVPRLSFLPLNDFIINDLHSSTKQEFTWYSLMLPFFHHLLRSVAWIIVSVYSVKKRDLIWKSEQKLNMNFQISKIWYWIMSKHFYLHFFSVRHFHSS